MAIEKADIKIIPGDTRILLIAPHGVMGDDDNTDLLTFEIQDRLKCFAIVNDAIPRSKINFNSVKSAAKHPTFLDAIKKVANAPGHTLVVWIHGGDVEGEKWANAIKANEFDCPPEAIDAFIGYGQGHNPKNKEGDPKSRYTATKKKAATIRDLLTKAGMVSILTGKESPDFKGREPDNMNQWFRNKPYPLKKVESIQIEIRKPGFRNDATESKRTGEIIASALSELVPPQEDAKEMEAATEPVVEIITVPEVLDEEAGTPFDNPDDEDLELTLEPDEIDAAESPRLPVVASVEPDAGIPTGSDEAAAEQAYQWIVAKYKEKVAEFTLEVGDYIIKTFYAGEPRRALAKNKRSDQPKSLRLLIKKFQSASPSENGPSETWFYRAVGLSAQISIAKEMGLSSLTILGHTHQVRLLNYPKLKEIKGDEFAAAIDPAFQVKEQLAQVAVEKNLTTREFGKYIKSQQDQLNLAKLPPKKDLLKRDAGELIRLYDLAQVKMDRNQKAAVGYGKARYRLKVAIAELTGNVPGDEKFQDWTKSKNNFNICTGCPNDCLYCYMKPIYDGKPGRKQPLDWANFNLRQKNVDEKRGLRDGLVGFPLSHDIFPEILDAYLEVLGKFLRAGNEVLIVSKPRLDCIRAICDASTFFRDKILFRFTIGAMDEDILSFWEPNAPTYEHRKECLAYAKERGFRTSVSIEPMLDTANIEALVADLDPLVTEDIWLGMMSHLDRMKNWSNAEGFENRKEAIEIGQTPPVITAIYDTYRDNPKIKWKSETLKVIIDHLKETGRVKEKAEIRDGRIDGSIVPRTIRFSGWDEINIKADDGTGVKATAPVIVSASRRTDIPAHYGDWFMERLRRGHLAVKYPKSRHIAFNNTRLITFWTKNPEPMIRHLDELDKMGIGYYFQFTLNDYDSEGFEPNLPPLAERIETFKTISARIGKERVVWRFDPLVLTDAITPEILLSKASRLMEHLSGGTEKMVISFLQASGHKKVERNLTKAGIKYRDFSADDIAYLAKRLSQAGAEHHIQVATCSEAHDLSEYGIIRNKCIDDALIRRCFTNDMALMAFVGDGTTILKDPGQRPNCDCWPSVDIGTLNTCSHLCHYCYANVSEKAVNANRERITGTGEMLVP